MGSRTTGQGKPFRRIVVGTDNNDLEVVIKWRCTERQGNAKKLPSVRQLAHRKGRRR